MFSLRKKTVEKRNSRGDIVRKEEVVTLTKRIHASTKTQPKKLHTPPTHWNPNFPLPLQRKVPLPLPPPPRTTFKEPMQIPTKEGRQVADMNKQDIGYLFYELLRRQQGGFSQRNDKYSDGKGSDAEGSDTEDTNSEESEAEDLNSEVSEAEDLNSEESEAEDINSEESEGEDLNSEESEAEDLNSEESEAEYMSSEESEAENINSEEASEEDEDSDDELPRRITDFDRSRSILSMKRQDRISHCFPVKINSDTDYNRGYGLIKMGNFC